MQGKANVISAKTGETVRNLTTKWTSYRLTYVELLWKSRCNASAAKAMIDDMLDIFFPQLKDENRLISEKTASATTYIHKIEPHNVKAQETAQGFADLKNTVDLFMTKDWKALAELGESDEMKNLAKEIETLNASITKLNGELVQIRKEINDLVYHFRNVLEDSGVTTFLSIFFPRFWIETVADFFSKFFHSIEIAEKRHKESTLVNEIDEKTKSRNKKDTELKAMKSAFEALKSSVSTGQADLEIVLNNLGLFNKVWSYINADLLALKDRLEMAATGEIEPKWLSDRLPVLEALYLALSISLHEYEVAVPKNLHVFDLEGFKKTL